MPTTSPVTPGGATTGTPLVAGGAVTDGPLTFGGARSGEPIRSGWSAVSPPGDSGGHDVFVQETPQSVVTVEHGLGFRPNVSLFSLDYAVKYRGFGVQHLGVNALRVSMDRPTACVVVLS